MEKGENTKMEIKYCKSHYFAYPVIFCNTTTTVKSWYLGFSSEIKSHRRLMGDQM